jgi:hypothetical protein
MEELTPTATPKGAPVDALPMITLNTLRGPDPGWLVQPGVRPRLGQLVHSYSPADDTCSVALVTRVYLSYLPLRIVPGSIDPYLVLADPAIAQAHHSGSFGARPDPAAERSVGFLNVKTTSWHRAMAGCPFGR